jgi:hypothetical protein
MSESNSDNGPSVAQRTTEAIVPEYAYEILDTPELRARYITYTDELIRTMTEDRIDTAIFLDKSARPVAWLVEELWDQLVPPHDEQGRPYVRPEIKFLNIDREQWGAVVGRSEDQGVDVHKIPTERIEELRGLFAPVKAKTQGRSLLEGKRVLIVDEVRVSGDTLAIAEQVIKRAFPEAASIRGVHWMDGQVKINPRTGVKMNTQLPVWYSDRKVTGRLVADRDTTKSMSSPSYRQQLGRYWLSTPFRGQHDERGLRLKAEVAQLAHDMKKHRLPYMPSPLWHDSGPDTIDNRIPRLNGGMQVDQYIQLRRKYPQLENFVGAFAVLNTEQPLVEN